MKKASPNKKDAFRTLTVKVLPVAKGGDGNNAPPPPSFVGTVIWA
jgi:hypothetical protein